LKPGLSSPALVTETSTAAIVWLTSRRILPNLKTNCLCFFEQLNVDTYPTTVLASPHGLDQVEYNLQDKKADTAVDRELH